jgi:hypothetical protein
MSGPRRNLLILSLLGALAVAGSVIPASSAPAEATTATGPASVSAGPGCPATMQVWVPSVSTVSTSDALAVAPGNLSPRARVEFGNQVVRVLSGHDTRWAWLGTTSCPASHAYAEPVNAAGQARSAVQDPEPAQVVANWSGYLSTDGNFTGSSMEWKVPSSGVNASGDSPSNTIWAGIGEGSNSGDLLVQSGADGTSPFVEIVPGESEVLVSGFTVKVGDHMGVVVTWDPVNLVAAFLLVNYTTGQTVERTQSDPSGTTGSTAEWIVERHEWCGTYCVYSPLADFGSEEIENGAAEQTVKGETTGGFIGEFNSYGPLNMTTCAGSLNSTGIPALAVPGGVNNVGDFTDAWKNAGTDDPANCTWTLRPAGAAYRATLPDGTDAILTDTTAGTSFSCSDATISGTTGTSPQSAEPALLATVTHDAFGSCTDKNADIWTLSQTAGSTWTINADVGSAEGVNTGNISGLALSSVGDVAGKSCSFQVSGSVPQGAMTFTDPHTLKITKAALTITGVSGDGCSSLGIKNKDSATFTATYTVTTPTSGIILNP